MSRQQTDGLRRRELLRELTLAATAGLLGLQPMPVAAEPPPETTKLRLAQGPAFCVAPYFLAEALLQGEGFTDIQYLKKASGAEGYKALAAGELDFSPYQAGDAVLDLEAGHPFLLLAGLHVGCYELFGTDQVRTIRDLKGKTVAVPQQLGSNQYTVLATMAAYVGLDPRTDIHWVLYSRAESIQLLAAGKIDAYLAFAPGGQELRAKQIGHVVVDTALDRPWSQYFCCLMAGNREFVRQHPVATKRYIRATLKAADLCALEPERTAQFLLDKGYTTSDYASQVMKELPYGQWREYNPEDTVRFYALRLHEAGMIKSSPQKIITQGTDWRFLTALKKELKG
jgi:NitT/TauT family transport system substrate-binding protein